MPTSFQNMATLTYTGGTVNSNIVTGELREVLTAVKTAVRETPQTDTHTQLLFSRVACAGAWEGEVYHLVLVFYETCYVLELFCTFHNHGLSVRTRRNVGFVAEADTMLLGMRV